MTNLTLTILTATACLGIAACDSSDGEVETTETVTETVPADAPDTVIVDPVASAETDDNGTRLSVGPDGARLDVENDNVDLSVGDGPDSVEVETE